MNTTYLSKFFECYRKPIKLKIFWIIQIVAVLIVILMKGLDTPYFELHVNATSSNPAKPAEPYYVVDLVPTLPSVKEYYSPSVTKLSNGDLLSVFYAGECELSPDTSIYQSIFHDGKWSEPKRLVTALQLTGYSRSFVRKIGNPSIYCAPDGKIHLFVCSVTLGGWAGSKLNHLISEDNGVTWMDKEGLQLSPFINISNSCRALAVTLDDGGFYLPTYYEMIRCYPEITRFDKDGNFVYKKRTTAHNYLLQPVLVPTDNRHSFVYYRNKGEKDKIVYYQSTDNGGVSWSNIEKTNLEAPDSSIAAGYLSAQKIFILAANIKSREKLALYYSKDGINYNLIKILEYQKGSTFAYPSILIKDGMVDIVYAWNDREAIKHIRFNPQWILNEVNKK